MSSENKTAALALQECSEEPNMEKVEEVKNCEIVLEQSTTNNISGNVDDGRHALHLPEVRIVKIECHELFLHSTLGTAYV